MHRHTPVYHPKDIPEYFKAAWNRYDPAGIADLFVDRADFVNVTGKWWDNKKDIYDAHAFGLRVIFQHSIMEVLTVKVKMLAEDISVVHAHIKITGQTAKGDVQAQARETLFIFVAKKADGVWLCESAQNTDIVYGKQTHISDDAGNLHAVSYKERIS